VKSSPSSTTGDEQFLQEYGRINIVHKPGGFSCLPWATVVFNVATAPGQHPARIELRPDGAIYWLSERNNKDGPTRSPPKFISLSGLVYIPRAPWNYGTSSDDCLPVSRPQLSDSPRQSHVKSCLKQVELKVPLGDGEEQVIQARCRLYKRLICQNGEGAYNTPAPANKKPGNKNPEKCGDMPHACVKSGSVLEGVNYKQCKQHCNDNNCWGFVMDKSASSCEWFQTCAKGAGEDCFDTDLGNLQDTSEGLELSVKAPPGTSCLQQKEGSCKDARIVPSVFFNPAQCHVDYCANILATL